MADAKKGRGCFFYGCLTLIIVVIVGLIALYFGTRLLVKKLLSFTSPTPVAVAPVSLSAADGGQLTNRVNDFTKALREGRATQPLVLSSEELDYLVRNSPGSLPIKDSIHLMITNDRVHAQLSYPLEAIRPELKGRYLNGEADFDVLVRNGAIMFDLESLKVKGDPVDPKFVTQMQKQPLEWRPEANDPNESLVKNVERVEIKDGKILFYPKTNAPPAK